MNEHFGVAGRDHRQLPLQQGRLQSYMAGPFASTLAPTPRQRLRGLPPEQLFVGLLVRPPNADGNLHQELAWEAYSRQQVTIASLNAAFHASVNKVVFPAPDGAAVSHVGLFNVDDELLFYGFLSGSRRRSTLPQEFEFPPFSLKTRKVPARVLLPRRY